MSIEKEMINDIELAKMAVENAINEYNIAKKKYYGYLQVNW